MDETQGQQQFQQMRQQDQQQQQIQHSYGQNAQSLQGSAQTQQNSQPFITMGSIISLQHFEDPNSFIYIDGHNNSKVMVQNFIQLSGNQTEETSSSINNPNGSSSTNPNTFGLSNPSATHPPGFDKSSNPYLPSDNPNNVHAKQPVKNLKFSGCLFQILPKLSDKQKEEILQRMRILRRQSRNSNNNSNHGNNYFQEDEDDDEEDLNTEMLLQNVNPRDFTSSAQVYEHLKESSFSNSQHTQQQQQQPRNIDLRQSSLKKRMQNDLDKEKVIQLQSKLMNEFKVNFEAFEKYKHNKISYNQTIQLMHLDSSKFLACHNQEANVQKNNYKVTLEDYTSENTLFKIVPAFKYQKDGDLTIYANEIIVIERVNPLHNKRSILHASEILYRSIQISNSSQIVDAPAQSAIQQKRRASTLVPRQSTVAQKLHHNSTQQIAMPLGGPIHPQQQFQQNLAPSPASIMPDMQLKREVNVTTEFERDPTKWKISLFSYYTENTQNKYLRCGDVIWLYHSEANASLGAVRKRELKEFNEKEWHHMDSKDNLELSFVPSDIFTGLDEYSGNTFGMWIIERKQFKAGGYVQYDYHYRLRHLSSGLYLAVEGRQQQQYNMQQDNLGQDETGVFGKNRIKKTTSPSSESSDNLQFKLVTIPSASSLFQFVSLENNPMSSASKLIKSDSFISLRHVATKTWLDIFKQNTLIQQQQSNNQQLNGVAANMQGSKASQGLRMDRSQQSLMNTSTTIFNIGDQPAVSDPLNPFQPSLSLVKNENQVFKLFSANESDVWEINLVISGSRELTKLLKVLSRNHNSSSSHGSNSIGSNIKIEIESPTAILNIQDTYLEAIKIQWKRIKGLRQTVRHLNDFCNNRMHNSSFDQKYGTTNRFRQKLLREQYFMDILAQLLSNVFEEAEFDLLKDLDNVIFKMTVQQQKETRKRNSRLMMAFGRQSSTGNNTILNSGMNGNYSYLPVNNELKMDDQQITQIQFLQFIKTKRTFCTAVYKLITSICKKNPENQLYAYNLIPLFQTHSRYIPDAINCIISIISQNEILLLKISNHLLLPAIDSKFMQQSRSAQINEIQIKHSFSLRFNYQQNNGSQRIMSENLLNYFMDLISDSDAPLKADYYRFLSSICKYKNNGISINQENIFKLYKLKQILSDSAPNYAAKFNGGIQQLPTDPEERVQLYHELNFLSEVSLGRNFQWLRELTRCFSFEYLLENIWKDIRAKSTTSLNTCFSKLAMTLYIDHYPLYRINAPNLCTVFNQTQQKEKFGQIEQNQQVMYQTLLDSLQDYLKGVGGQVEQELKSRNDQMLQIKKEKEKNLNKYSDPKELSCRETGSQILNEDLLFQSMDLLNLLVNLNVFEILSRKADYRELVQNLIRILGYDRLNLSFCSASYFNSKKVAEQKMEDKRNILLKKFPKIDVKINDFNIFADFTDDNENEQNLEEEGEQDEMNKASTKIDENQLYHNPLMRGYLKMNCLLEGQITSEEDGTQLEIGLKLKICEFFEKLLDLRQDFLIKNTIQWFYLNAGELLASEPQNIDHLFLEGLSKVMPNIPKTGFKEIDEIYGFHKETSNIFQVLQTKQQQTIFKFETFCENKFSDLDGLLSVSYTKTDEEEDSPSFAILPYLLSSFYLMHNPKLEKKCLSLMMRIFDQRRELQQNLSQLEVIFDKEKAILYRIVKKSVHTLSMLLEQSEDWFEEFMKPEFDDTQFLPAHQVKTLLTNLRNSFFNKLQLDEQNMTIQLDQESTKTKKAVIDPNKQKIFRYLKAYQPILSFIKDGIHHFNAVLCDMNQPDSKKRLIFEIFSLSYEVLTNFCLENTENQFILHSDVLPLMQFLNIDIGQIALLCEIFRENLQLLKDKSNSQIIQNLVELLHTHGRQHRVLDFFIIFIKSNHTYIFDNQLLILNTFLPTNPTNYDHLQLLFARQTSSPTQYQHSFNNLHKQTTGLDKENMGIMGVHHNLNIFNHKTLDKQFTTTSKLNPIKMEILDSTGIQFSFDSEYSNDSDLSFLDYMLKRKTTKRDDAFKYHAKLLNMLLQTAYIQELTNIKQTTSNNKSNFNISIAKLKSIDSHFLKDILLLPDEFILPIKGGSLQQQQQLLQSKEEVQQDSSKIEKDKQPLENKEQLIIQDHIKDPIKEGYTFLKPQIVEFIKNVYILGENFQTIQSENSLLMQFLQSIVSYELNRLKDIRKKHVLTANYFTYILDYIIPFLQAYLDKYLPNIKILNERDHKDLLILKSFGNQLLKKITFFDSKISNIQNERLVYFLREVLQDELNINTDMINTKEAIHNYLNTDEIHEEMKSQSISNMARNLRNITAQAEKESSGAVAAVFGHSGLQQSNSLKKVRKRITMFQSFQNSIKKGIRLISKPTTVRQVQSPSQAVNDVRLSKIWHNFVNYMNTNSTVNEEITKEKRALTEAILEIKQVIPEEDLQNIEPKPDRYALIKKLIAFLQYGVEDVMNRKTIIVLLRVLRSIVEKCTGEEKVRMQTMLDQLGATRMVLYVICENHNNLTAEILSHFLQLLNTLLQGGNLRVQKSLFEYYKSHSKSEIIFKRLDGIIRKQIERVERQKGQQFQQQQQQQPNSASNTGAFSSFKIIDDIVGSTNDNSNTSTDPSLHDPELEVLDNVLTFLQYSVEGHYLDLQNYLRSQTNSRNSYDMIIAVADLLKTYYYNARTQKMYENMIHCLDTLNELVQGPCLENQIAVSESKFFEIANDLFTSSKHLQDTLFRQSSLIQNRTLLPRQSTIISRPVRTDDLTNWQIARMQNKSLVLILSLLEMRVIDESNAIIKKIMRSLSLQQLEYQLVDIYKLYSTLYNDEYTLECLQYVDIDPNELPANKLPHLDCIVQNGFYIIYLIQYFLLFDDKQENVLASLYKLHKEKQLKMNKTALDGLLYGDHLFGQMASFFMSFIKAGLKSANEMKNFALDKIKGGEEDEQKRIKDEEDQHKIWLKKAFFFFSDNIAHIDITRNNQTQILFFHILPYMHWIPKEKKNEFHENVDRQSVKSKIEYLVAQSENLIEISKHEFRLQQLFSHNKFIALFANYVGLWKQLTFTMTIILNIFNMLSFDASFGDRMSIYLLYNIDGNTRFSQSSTKNIYLILGIIMTVCSVFVVLFFLFKNVPLIIKKNWIVRYGSKTPGLIRRSVMQVKLFLKVFFIFLQDIEVIYYIAYGLLAVLGTFLHPFFFTFHLTEIIIRYPTLKNVLKSVSIPRKQFYLTFILFLIFVYSFTILSYTFFHEDYLGNCDQFLGCFLINFDQTFKSNGGVGGWLTSLESDNGRGSSNYSAGRLLFDNFYNYILVIILVQIVAGLIVEAFEGLREKESIKNRDISDKCFICDNQKTEFNRKQDNNGGFKEHIKLNHYMWSYLNFIAYIKHKEPTEYTGIESYIFDKLENHDISWFPINKARELNVSHEENDEKEYNYIRSLNQNLLNSMDNLCEVNKAFTKSSKKKQNG